MIPQPVRRGRRSQGPEPRPHPCATSGRRQGAQARQAPVRVRLLAITRLLRP